MPELDLLPSRGLDQSIVLAVLAGMWFLLFFTEVFGWVFVGLVVPGYLASVFVIQPAAGFAITVESVVTFMVARFLSDTLARTGAFSPFFGRERFFLIILISVIVRQQSQIWLMPELAHGLARFFGQSPYLEYDLASIGLVLVPLVANAMWKLDVPRGVFQIGLPVVLVYALLRLVLLPYTNLSYATLELTYENVALDFLASPKAYIVLLTGGYLGARFNLRFGWDYNGILVPALLSLAWFVPVRLVSTTVEALALVWLSKKVMGLPLLRTKNLAGPRTMALVFTTGFFFKVAVALVVAPFVTAVPTQDLFGFGYLISSLLAVKMLQKKVVGRIILPSLLVSFVGFVAGSGIGFILDQLFPLGHTARAAAGAAPAPSTRLTSTPLGLAVLGQVRASHRGATGAPTRAELTRYARWVRVTGDWIDGDAGAAAGSRFLAAELGLAVTPLAAPLGGRPAYGVYEQEERLGLERGLATFVLVPGAPGPVIVVPRPASQAPAAPLGVALCAALECRALVIAGRDAAVASELDPGADENPADGLASERLGRAPRLVVRVDPSAAAARLHVVGAAPAGLDLGARYPLEVALDFEPAPGEAARTDTAVLMVPTEVAWPVVARGADPRRSPGIDLGEWQQGRLDPAAASGEDRPTAARVPPSETELMVLEALARTLLGPAGTGPLALPRDPATRGRWLGALAALVGFELTLLPDGGGPGAAVWVLDGRAADLGLFAARERAWGAASREASAAPVCVGAPSPGREVGSLAIGLDLWRNLTAVCAFAGGRGDPGAPDPAAAEATVAAWVRAASEVLATSTAEPGGADPLILLIRGLGSARGESAALLVGVGAPVMDPADVSPRLRALVGPSGWLGPLAPKDGPFADGRADRLGLDGRADPYARYARLRGAPSLALLWFSAATRRSFGNDLGAGEERLAAAGLTAIDGDPARALTAPPLEPVGASGPPPAPRFDALVAVARSYAADDNVHRLRRLVAEAESAGASVLALRSRVHGRLWLSLELTSAGVTHRALVLLGENADETTLTLSPADPGLAAQAARAITGRTRALILVGVATFAGARP
jgi:hypothetical protein